ncbi:thioesterase II family protein [Streptomyces sp. NPDC001401]|uniref:thioesterase II family protein n=1 Tax=Streptomyces sp. NPDC001401 TaxID=3364570 RepID=UPI0036ABC7DF
MSSSRPPLRNRWLPREPSRTARARVFLIPYSGCGASMYRQWPAERDGVEFLPVELPGHESRFVEPNFTSYAELGEQMSEGLAPYLDVPFGFFGHCGSALAAYETSVQLVTRNVATPSALFVSSEVAPQDGPAGRFLAMDDHELGAELEKLIRELGGTPSAELIELYLEVLRADVETNKRYVVPEPFRLPCPIVAVGWTGDEEIPYSTMGGWPTCGETKSVLLEGGHHRFIEAPDDLLDLMGAALGAAS